MTDKITKLLSKLSKKDLTRIRYTLAQILDQRLEQLDVKAIKGHNSLFRVRVGNYRIIFQIDEERNIAILSIGRRSEKTYRDL